MNSERDNQRMESPNILLIIIDAVRPDHCSCYGYERRTTPNIDKIADDGIRYKNAFSNSNWTAEAHGSLFTGHLSSVSGIYGDNLPLPESIPTLPELLQDAGYNTFGVSAGAHIRSDRGYDRGFSNFYSTTELGLGHEIIPKIEGSARASIENYVHSVIRGGDGYTHFKARSLTHQFNNSQQPFFGFVNFKTAHSPYHKKVPEPYKSCFTNDSIRCKNPILDFAHRIILNKGPDNIDGIDYDRLCEISDNYPLLTEKFQPKKKEWKIIKDWYDGAIRYTDKKIGMILQTIRKENNLDNTWIIITADHGEMFGEHGLENHIFSLYDELLSIPLIIRPPSGSKQDVSGMVSWIDLYPTICEIAGVNYPDRPHAKSLLPPGSDPKHEHIYAEVARKANPKIKENHPDFGSIRVNGPLQSIRDESWKLIKYPSGEVELFNWVTDPDEQDDRSKQNPGIVENLLDKMESELGNMNTSSHHDGNVTLSSEVVETLESLGYR
jgi:arylsulfatase A-like enzyme